MSHLPRQRRTEHAPLRPQASSTAWRRGGVDPKIIVLIIVALIAAGYWGMQLLGSGGQGALVFRDVKDGSEVDLSYDEFYEYKREKNAVQGALPGRAGMPSRIRNTETNLFTLVLVDDNGELPEFPEDFDWTADPTDAPSGLTPESAAGGGGGRALR